MKLSFNKRRNKQARKDECKFLLFPRYFKGNVFWLSKVKIEKSFNGFTMQTINIKKL